MERTFYFNGTNKENQIDALFSDWNQLSTQGCALAIIENGEITYSCGYGIAIRGKNDES